MSPVMGSWTCQTALCAGTSSKGLCVRTLDLVVQPLALVDITIWKGVPTPAPALLGPELPFKHAPILISRSATPAQQRVRQELEMHAST